MRHAWRTRPNVVEAASHTKVVRRSGGCERGEEIPQGGRFHQRRKVIGVRVHVVTDPRLAGACDRWWPPAPHEHGAAARRMPRSTGMDTPAVAVVEAGSLSGRCVRLAIKRTGARLARRG